jgi:hypothetical protein
MTKFSCASFKSAKGEVLRYALENKPMHEVINNIIKANPNDSTLEITSIWIEDVGKKSKKSLYL